MPGLLDFVKGANDSAASTIYGPVGLLATLLRKTGLPIPDDKNVVGSQQWLLSRGLTTEAPANGAGVAGQTVGLLAPFLASEAGRKALSAMLSGINAKEVARQQPQMAFRGGKLEDPPVLAARPFVDDYKSQASAADASGKLTSTIDGAPIQAQYVAGRTELGGPDRGLPARAVQDVLGKLGYTIEQTPAKKLGSDLGRIDGPGKKIAISSGVTDAQLPHVLTHEAGHAIDYGVFGRAIPQDGLATELRAIYKALNDPNAHYQPSKLFTPEIMKYRGNDVPAEYMAEAIRAYIRDPNYIKTVAPKTAARIREHVNTHPQLSKLIQFNAAPIGAVGAGALLGGGLLQGQVDGNY